MKIEWVGTTNFTSGRGGRKPIAIVNHITAGAFPGCLSWMQNPAAKASAHYLITRTGRILQLVKDEDTAWANGRANKPLWKLYDGTNPNRYTLSIEHEGYGSQGGNGALTEAQYQATLWLHKELIRRHGIPIDRDHIIGHYQVDSVDRPNCPGPKFPWDRLIKDLTGGVNMTETKILFEGKELKGFIIDGRTYAEVRALAEMLGLKVFWNNEKRQVEVSK